MKKKISFVLLTTMLILSGLTVLEENKASAELFGKISYYEPKKAGGHGKWLTENDCALDKLYQFTPKGTKVTVVNLANNKKKILEKWDWGNFAKDGVIVDVLPKTFVALGGKTKDGYIDKGYANF